MFVHITALCRKSCGIYGHCVAPNVCQCKKGWRGKQCNKCKCNKFKFNGRVHTCEYKLEICYYIHLFTCSDLLAIQVCTK